MSSEPEPTVAAFAPTQRRVLVQQQSPLLNATPPQITRALTYSHPFLLPLTKLVGLLSWSGDPWESFLVVAVFWATVLYGDEVIRWAGPLVVGGLLVGGLYLRRYSPLSTRSHRKSLDEIVETLNTFTARCNVLVEPLLQLTEFLSTQRSPTSTTTRPALTTLLLRLLALLPIWIVPTIATRHVMLVAGTLILSWHSRPARISRTLLWRSRTVRRLVSFITGLRLTPEKSYAAVTTGVKFTFTLWQNQRRWLGLGWTSSMLAYERAAWTDEHLNASPSKDDFKPTVNGAVWKWVSEWKDDGWIYYDNKWNDGRRQDGWGRYTRRRKWYRNAQLVEADPTELPANETLADETPANEISANETVPKETDTKTTKRRFFKRDKITPGRAKSVLSDDEADRSIPDRPEIKGDWSLGDEVKMGLG